MALLVAATGVSALAAVWTKVALMWAMRVALVGGLLLALLAMRPHIEQRLRLLRAAAAATFCGWAAVWVLAQLSPAVRQWAYELGDHQHIGDLGRFSGLSSSPTSSGEMLLAAVAMIQALPGRPVRMGLTIAGLAMAALSLSVATLAVPLALIVAYVPWRRTRRLLAVGWVAASLLVMYVHPIQIVAAGHQVHKGALHPSWSASGLGPVHTPLKTVKLGDWSVTGHASQYWQCVSGNLSCFAAHPVAGVGGMNFRSSCPVTTMDSYGTWLAGRRPHNQYLALASEHGVFGVVAGMLLVWAFLRRTRFALGSPLEAGILWAYVLCGMQGDVWLQFCAAAWLGTSLELKDPDP